MLLKYMSNEYKYKFKDESELPSREGIARKE
jgi:hypothetical protein